MAEIKTKETAVDVDDFIANIDDERKRDDARTIVRMMSQITGEPPRMWGPSIIGFGYYYYKYDSGHEGLLCMAGFSPRKAALTLYIGADFPAYEGLASKLGKHTQSKGCLYIKRLDDVDVDVLEKLIEESVADTKRKYLTGEAAVNAAAASKAAKKSGGAKKTAAAKTNGTKKASGSNKRK
jgi:hypothetical protein